MPVDPQNVINSRLGVELMLRLGRVIPPKVGYPLSRFAANRIAARGNWSLVSAARANQWVVSGGNLSADELDLRVREMFRHTARAIYELNHFIHNPEMVSRLVQYDAVGRQIIERGQDEKRGMIVVGVHLGNFDFALRAAAIKGLRALVLTLPNLDGGYQLQYDMRKDLGMEILPASVSSFRQAVEHLRTGGVVLTGIDRPLTSTKYRPQFFGHPASLPVQHISLALKARVPVVVAATMMQPDSSYRFKFSEPIEMVSHPDRRAEIVSNAESVLQVAEEYIRQAPQQWSMFFPVWPDVMELVP
jgi:KDO2-lipid IV(A) lauroyltransferase